MKCKKCQKELVGKQKSYCSDHCSKLHLKSLWRKRTKDKRNEYNRRYRSLGLRPMSTDRKHKIIKSKGGICFRCGIDSKLNVHHIKPLRFGGTHEDVLVLCFDCHMKWERRMLGYWDRSPLPRLGRIG